jgi:hypothetical protein
MWQENRLEILCGTVIIAVLIATLWPFSFLPPNRVSWLPEANGIRLGSNGLVVSKGLLKAGGTEPRETCSLEVLLRPVGTKSVHTILSFYVSNNARQFLVRQWTDGLLVSHDFLDAQNKVKRAKFDVDHAFQEGKLLLLTMTSGPHGTVVYTNGTQTQFFPRFRISQSDLTGQIVMGTSAVDFEPWSGEVRGLAIYSKELTPAEVLRHDRNWTDERGPGPPDLDGAIAYYAFIEGAGRDIHNAIVSGPDLEIPKWFGVPHKALLESPIKEFEANWDYVNDVLRNVAGFVPLGFIVCAYWARARSRPQAIRYAILSGGILSFVIEVLQAYIPQRSSGVTDIITNTLGTALGAVLARPSIVQSILGRIGSIPVEGSPVSRQD